MVVLGGRWETRSLRLLTSTLLLLLWGPVPLRTLLAFVAMLSTYETFPRKFSPSLTLQPTALIAVTTPTLAMLTMLKLLLAWMAVMAILALMAIPETSLAISETS